jgi:hypothetical protein
MNSGRQVLSGIPPPSPARHVQVAVSETELGHNTGACVPFRMKNRPLFWIANSIKRKASTRPAPASAARSAVGRPARTTAGLVAAAIAGYVRYGRSVPRLSSPVDFNPVPLLYPLVATLRLVCAGMKSRLTASRYTQHR